MTGSTRQGRILGTMVTCGYPKVDLQADLTLAKRLGARCLELLPYWANTPDPNLVRRQLAETDFLVHSVHGTWGSQTIKAFRVDLGHPEPVRRQESVDDLKRCLDWLQAVGGRILVVHPGGLSDSSELAERTEALQEGLEALANHASESDLMVCVENMPAGVHPGSKMVDLAALVSSLNRPELGLILDTGHANIVSSAAEETRAAGHWLQSTHVHDNDGKQDAHLPPGAGTVSWEAWLQALDAIGYEGPILLECIRQLRRVPESWDDRFFALLDRFQLNGGSCGD